ncbi:O-antigen ligase [Microbacterium endophyticum]|uniref:O-antigen ligase n=1 Tax=Microbacterium endophyticum TaxID=1526412 RepID=A0A7W4V3T3_9MICO|nr:O-antigen ligase family protein [Microbacterium endophyticum]MBB2976326.1 O-antigen ligase [Microbacterium endophyticum]NIK35206.1 O-antigen ligase [Microbacterium endophyticum]
MAVHTKHPIAAPPAAPPREKTRHLMLRAWCVFVLFQAFAGVAWVNAFGDFIAGSIAAVSAIISAVLWVSIRPPLNWRRLPWFPLGYVAWALTSVFWSSWLSTTALTWTLLACTTLQGLMVASMLGWKELIRAMAAALKWVISLSLLFELAVSVFINGPVLPGFVIPTTKLDPIVYWSRNNLFDGGRIQGIFGNANLLASVALTAMIVFALLFAAHTTRRVPLALWFSAATYAFVRADSATAYLSAIAVAVVLTTSLLMRTARRPGSRTKYYAAFAGLGALGIAAVWVWRDAIFTALGRSSTLTGRETIWQAVLDRAVEHPVVGWGFATPWLDSDPAFDGWIIDHGQSVMQAHNMWIDVFLQLGAVGLFIMVGIYFSVIWRAWFFAVDRPRWDLVDSRPFSPLTLLPILLMSMLLVQGLAESGPLLLWGWLSVVMLGFKIKQAPLIGVGPTGQTLAMERGDGLATLAKTQHT